MRVHTWLPMVALLICCGTFANAAIQTQGFRGSDPFRLSAGGACDDYKDCNGGEVCVDDVCQPCFQSGQCPESELCVDSNGNVLDSSGTADLTGECESIQLFREWNWRYLMATITIFTGASIAAGGGLGGGGIFVPTYILIAGLSTDISIPLSQATIFGGSLVNMYVYMQSKHPTMPDRPLIDFNAVLVLSPMLLAGTSLGVILHSILPGWMVVMLLAFVLVYATQRTVKKAQKAWDKESMMRENGDNLLENAANADHQEFNITESKEQKDADAQSGSDSSVDGIQTQSINLKDMSDGKAIDASVDVVYSDEEKAELAEILEAENSPLRALLLITVVWVAVFLQALFRSGELFSVPRCEPLFFVLSFGPLPFYVLFSLWIGKGLSSAHSRKMELGYDYKEGEIQWTERNSMLYPVLAAISGIMGGLLGIGGGMILGPLLLELGLLSQTVSATSASAVALSASSATLQYMILGKLLPDFGIWFSAVGILSTILGLFGINYFVKKYNRSSLIVMAIAAVLVCATPMMILADVIELVHLAESGESLGLKDYCGGH